MSSNKSETFTVMIVPKSNEETFNFELSHRFVFWGGVFLIAFLISAVSMVYSLRQTRAQLDSYHALLSENRQQQEHILFLAKQTQSLNDQLASVRDLDASIRVMMDLSTPVAQTPSSLASAGGPPVSSEIRGSAVVPGTSLAATLLRTQQTIEQIRESIPETEDSLKNLENTVQLQRAREMATPSIRPTNGSITSGFGYRRSPFGVAREFHPGVDMSAPRGTQVYAAATGTVVMAAHSGGYGNVIFIDHGFGFSTVYAHLSRINVKAGQTVTKGQSIGLVGSTGRSTAPHLHYEVRVNGTAVNPYSYLTGGR